MAGNAGGTAGIVRHRAEITAHHPAADTALLRVAATAEEDRAAADQAAALLTLPDLLRGILGDRLPQALGRGFVFLARLDFPNRKFEEFLRGYGLRPVLQSQPQGVFLAKQFARPEHDVKQTGALQVVQPVHTKANDGCLLKTLVQDLALLISPGFRPPSGEAALPCLAEDVIAV